MAIDDRNLEALYQATARIVTREDNRTTLDVLFENAPKMRRKERALVEKLFIQTPGAEISAPALQKEAAVNVKVWFEKNAHLLGRTEAQIRYPELMKAADSATPRPSTVPVKKAGPNTTSGATPTRSPLSGGNS